MKKALIYISIIVVAAFIGLTTFYLVRNQETINMTIPESSIVYLNASETLDYPIEHIKPHNKTTISFASSDESVVKVNDDDGRLEATTKGGQATITITTNNKTFGVKTFTVNVSDGSTEFPYYISTAAQFSNIGKIGADSELIIDGWTLDANYKLINDIDLAVLKQSWTPIGGSDGVFTGSFNGSMNTISNLKINGDMTYAGLFGKAGSNSIIQNIRLQGVNIVGGFDYVGSIVGYTSGNVKKCFVEAAQNYGSVINYKYTAVDNPTTYTGGLVGLSSRDMFVRKSIELCSVKLGILNGRGYVGGISGGLVANVIFDCYADTTINNATVKNDDLVDVAVANGTVGGISGFVNSAVKIENEMSFTRESIIKHSFARTIIGAQGTYTAFGGVAGKIDYSKNISSTELANKIIGCFYHTLDATVKAISNTAPVNAEVIASHMESYNDAASFIYGEDVAWNFENVWSIKNSKPTISIESTSEDLGIFELGLTVDATFFNILQGASAGAELLSYNYSIKDPIVIDYGTGLNTYGEFAQIKQFNGSITPSSPAHTLTVKNFKITTANEPVDGLTNVGIFNRLEGASLSNIIIENFEINIQNLNGDKSSVGVLCGTATNSTLSNISIKSEGTAVNIKPAATSGMANSNEICASFGALAGTVNSESVINEISVSRFSIHVDGVNANAGGLVGDMSDSIVGNKYLTDSTKRINLGNYISISGKSKVNAGGAIGAMFNSNVCGVYRENAGGITAVSANDEVNVGGVIGLMHRASSDGNNASVLQYSMNNNVSVKDVSAELAYVGGLVGRMNEYAVVEFCSVNNGEVAGNKAAGLVAYVEKNAKLSKCSTNTKLTGPEVGGLAHIVYGYVVDCYTACSLNIIDGGEVHESASGFATYVLDENYGKIEHCVSSCQYAGLLSGTAQIEHYFPESRNLTRRPLFGSILNDDVAGSFGQIVNSAYNAQYIQYVAWNPSDNSTVATNTIEKVAGNIVRYWYTSGIVNTFSGRTNEAKFVTFEESMGLGSEAIDKLKSYGIVSPTWILEETGFPALANVPVPSIGDDE